MQAHNVAIPQVKIDNNSRGGYTVTPISSMTTDEHNAYSINNHNYMQQNEHMFSQRAPPSSKNYSHSSSSDHHSISVVSQISSQNNGSLIRKVHMDPPSSPKSVSTRSQYSTEIRM